MGGLQPLCKYSSATIQTLFYLVYKKRHKKEQDGYKKFLIFLLIGKPCAASIAIRSLCSQLRAASVLPAHMT